MTNNVIEATIGNGSFVAPVWDRRTLLLLLATQDTVEHPSDALMDAEDVLLQADEALVMG